MLTESDHHIGEGAKIASPESGIDQHNAGADQESAVSPATAVSEGVGTLSTAKTVDMGALADQLWSRAVAPGMLRDSSL